MEEDLEISLDRQKRDTHALLEAYDPAEDNRSFHCRLVNCMGFWIATGKGAHSLVALHL